MAKRADCGNLIISVHTAIVEFSLSLRQYLYVAQNGSELTILPPQPPSHFLPSRTTIGCHLPSLQGWHPCLSYEYNVIY